MQLEMLRRPFEPALRRVLHFYWRFARGLPSACEAWSSTGGRVFLVKHSYVAGWHLPGGGVEAGETLATALTRELREEGNIELAEPPVFFAIYFKHARLAARSRRALSLVRSFHQSAPPQPNSEIVAHGFFSPNALPEDTTLATRARIAEVLEGRVAAEIW